MAGTGDDSSTDVWQQFRLLREAHAYFLELAGLEDLAYKLVVNFLRGGEFDPFTGRRRYRLYEIEPFLRGQHPVHTMASFGALIPSVTSIARSIAGAVPRVGLVQLQRNGRLSTDDKRPSTTSP